MSWFTGIVVYFMLWWLALFVVLPWGNHPVEQPEKGHASSAPAKPRLLMKFIATSILAGIIWLVVYVLIDIQIIDLYGIAEGMIEEDRHRQ